MCGRYTLAHTHKEIMERFRVQQQIIEFDIEARYNVAPSQVVPIIIERPGETEEDAAVRYLEIAQWGLVPGWVKDPRLLKPMINARAETVVEKRTFSGAFKKRRCLIPADSFYEWTTIKKKRHPIRFQLKDGNVFAFAGLYESWKAPDGEIRRTCAIVTVAPNDMVGQFHDRMPAILHPDAEDIWLKRGEDEARLLSLLGPYDQSKMKFYRANPVVNSAKLDTIECIQPAEDEPEVEQCKIAFS